MDLSDSLRFLRDYIAIPSVNPMGRSDMPAAILGETRLAEFVEQQLRHLSLDAICVGNDDRKSVIAEARVRDPLDTILIASHLDTVPIDGMEIDPFDPVIQNGRLSGRGSCDTKAGMAAFVAALAGVLRKGTLRRNVILVGEADEEFGSIGVQDTLQHLSREAALSLRPDWVLATEPTNLRLVSHHKGIALIRLHAHGQACHSSNPGAGENALVNLARAILALEDHAGELTQEIHPLLGSPTLSVGLAGGGTAPNIVPDAAWLEMDRRLLPGEDLENVASAIAQALEKNDVHNVEIASISLGKGALDTASDHVSVRASQSALASLRLPTEPTQAAFSTDAGVFAEEGLPGIVFGPGSIEQAHTAREFVETKQVETATAFFTALLEGRGSDA